MRATRRVTPYELVHTRDVTTFRAATYLGRVDALSLSAVRTHASRFTRSALTKAEVFGAVLRMELADVRAQEDDGAAEEGDATSDGAEGADESDGEASDRCAGNAPAMPVVGVHGQSVGRGRACAR